MIFIGHLSTSFKMRLLSHSDASMRQSCRVMGFFSQSLGIDPGNLGNNSPSSDSYWIAPSIDAQAFVNTSAFFFLIANFLALHGRAPRLTPAACSLTRFFRVLLRAANILIGKYYESREHRVGASRSLLFWVMESTPLRMTGWNCTTLSLSPTLDFACLHDSRMSDRTDSTTVSLMHCTLSFTVCKCTPCQRASFNSTTDSFSWGHDR